MCEASVSIDSIPPLEVLKRCSQGRQCWAQIFEGLNGAQTRPPDWSLASLRWTSGKVFDIGLERKFWAAWFPMTSSAPSKKRPAASKTGELHPFKQYLDLHAQKGSKQCFPVHAIQQGVPQFFVWGGEGAFSRASCLGFGKKPNRKPVLEAHP